MYAVVEREILHIHMYIEKNNHKNTTHTINHKIKIFSAIPFQTNVKHGCMGMRLRCVHSKQAIAMLGPSPPRSTVSF